MNKLLYGLTHPSGKQQKSSSGQIQLSESEQQIANAILQTSHLQVTAQLKSANQLKKGDLLQVKGIAIVLPQGYFIQGDRSIKVQHDCRVAQLTPQQIEQLLVADQVDSRAYRAYFKQRQQPYDSIISQLQQQLTMYNVLKQKNKLEDIKHIQAQIMPLAAQVVLEPYQVLKASTDFTYNSYYLKSGRLQILKDGQIIGYVVPSELIDELNALAKLKSIVFRAITSSVVVKIDTFNLSKVVSKDNQVYRVISSMLQLNVAPIAEDLVYQSASFAGCQLNGVLQTHRAGDVLIKSTQLIDVLVVLKGSLAVNQGKKLVCEISEGYIYFHPTGGLTVSSIGASQTMILTRSDYSIVLQNYPHIKQLELKHPTLADEVQDTDLIVKRLSKWSFLKALNPDVLQLVAKSVISLELHDGQFIAGEEYFYVVSGRVKVLQDGQTISTVRTGEHFAVSKHLLYQSYGEYTNLLQLTKETVEHLSSDSLHRIKYIVNQTASDLAKLQISRTSTNQDQSQAGGLFKYDLPSDIILLILSHLGRSDRLRLRLLNSQWDNFICNGNSDITSIHIDQTCQSISQYMALIKVAGASLRSITIGRSLTFNKSHSTVLAQFCPNIEHFAIEQQSATWKSFVNLYDTLKPIFKTMVNLVSLQIKAENTVASSSPSRTFPVPQFKHLQVLHLFGSSSLQGEDFKTLIGCNRYLKEFVWQKARGLEDSQVRQLCEGWKLLETLRLNGAHKLKDVSCKFIATLPRLQHLSLQFAIGITNTGIFELSQSAHQYKSLNLSCNFNITDEALYYFQPKSLVLVGGYQLETMSGVDYADHLLLASQLSKTQRSLRWIK